MGKIMTKLRIEESSGVDTPAQEPAAVVLFKSASKPGDTGAERGERAEALAKASGSALTSSVDGHSHLIVLSSGTAAYMSGFTSWDATGHEHPWVLSDGNVMIGEASGHTHVVTVQTVAAPEPVAKAVKVEVAKPVVKAEDDESVVKAKDDETEDDETEDDEEVYVSKSVGPVMKSDGPLALKLAKQADDALVRAERAEQAAETLKLTKRAEVDLANLPGNLDVRVALVKACQDASDEVGDEMMKTLKAADQVYKTYTEPVGTAAGADEPSEAKEELHKRATALAKSEKITYNDAYVQVLKTPEGGALYNQV